MLKHALQFPKYFLHSFILLVKKALLKKICIYFFNLIDSYLNIITIWQKAEFFLKVRTLIDIIINLKSLVNEYSKYVLKFPLRDIKNDKQILKRVEYFKDVYKLQKKFKHLNTLLIYFLNFNNKSEFICLTELRRFEYHILRKAMVVIFKYTFSPIK